MVPSQFHGQPRVGEGCEHRLANIQQFRGFVEARPYGAGAPAGREYARAPRNQLEGGEGSEPRVQRIGKVGKKARVYIAQEGERQVHGFGARPANRRIGGAHFPLQGLEGLPELFIHADRDECSNFFHLKTFPR